MRKIAIAMGMLGLGTLAVNGLASPQLPGAGATAAPTAVGTTNVNSAPTVHIVGFQRIGTGSYTSGPVWVEVAVQNTGATAASVKVRLGIGLTFPEQSVDVPAKSTAKVALNDTAGLENSCLPRAYFLTLTGAGADTATRHATITPTCAFSTKVTDPWNLATPDHVEAAKKGHVFATNVAVEGIPTCASGVKLKATVSNQAAKAGTSLILGERSGQVVFGQSTAFALPVGTGKEVSALGAPGRVPETIDVVVSDPTNNLTSSIVNQGVSVAVTRSCVLTSALDP